MFVLQTKDKRLKLWFMILDRGSKGYLDKDDYLRYLIDVRMDKIDGKELAQELSLNTAKVDLEAFKRIYSAKHNESKLLTHYWGMQKKWELTRHGSVMRLEKPPYEFDFRRWAERKELQKKVKKRDERDQEDLDRVKFIFALMDFGSKGYLDLDDYCHYVINIQHRGKEGQCYETVRAEFAKPWPAELKALRCETNVDIGGFKRLYVKYRSPDEDGDFKIFRRCSIKID